MFSCKVFRLFPETYNALSTLNILSGVFAIKVFLNYFVLAIPLIADLLFVSLAYIFVCYLTPLNDKIIEFRYSYLISFSVINISTSAR